MNKKNNAVDLTDIALAVLIIGITVSIGSRMLITYRDNRLSDLGTYSTANETINVSSAAGGSDTFDNGWFDSVTTCYNSTNGVVIGSGNYTISVDSVTGVGTITNVTTDATCDYGWNCTYSAYNTSEAQWSLPDSAATGLAEYGNWFDIIVIIGVAGLILSLIFLAFGDKKGQGAGTY